MKGRLTRVDAEGVPTIVQSLRWNGHTRTFCADMFDGERLFLNEYFADCPLFEDGERLWDEIYWDVERNINERRDA